MHIIILLNARSGTSADRKLHEKIANACVRHAIAARIVECDGHDLVMRARDMASEAPRPALMVAAGGDGTVSAIAGIVVGTDIVLGIIPTGTFNHFAKDLGIPLGVDAAVALLADPAIRHVDIGQVNDRHFVNNSAIGLYPALVTDRDRQRRRFGRARWLASLVAALRVAGRLRILRLTLDFGSGDYRVRTPLLFVGNNEYRADLRSRFRRTTLTEGSLVAHIVRRERWWTIFGLLLRLVLGRTDRHDLETHEMTSLSIRTRRRRRLRVALDGEVYRMQTPLAYRILPAALAVAVPRSI